MPITPADDAVSSIGLINLLIDREHLIDRNIEWTDRQVGQQLLLERESKEKGPGGLGGRGEQACEVPVVISAP